MSKNTNSSGLGLSSVLTIIFVVLKLVGTINWSWWWVLSPILIDLGFWLIVIVIYVAVALRYENKYHTVSKRGKKK